MSNPRMFISERSGAIFHPRVNKGVKVLTTHRRDQINMRGREAVSVCSKVSGREGMKW